MTTRRILLLSLFVTLIGCSGVQPDLARLYQFDPSTGQARPDPSDREIQPPVIVIPGIVSSTLVDENGKEVWFGPWLNALFGSFEGMALGIDPKSLKPKSSNIRAGVLPDKVLGFIDFYGSLFDVLENYGGYRFTEPGEKYVKHERRYYKFAYDWRYDNVLTVTELDRFIEQIRADYGMPDLKVDIIAHSMGGLVARYYMRYGTIDVLDDNHFPVDQAGAKKVRQLIQLGAPNLGSIAALHQLIEGYQVLFSGVPVEVLATMPSVYQLLPHPLNTWLVDIEGNPLDIDLYDVRTWRTYEWGIFNPEVVERVVAKFDSEVEGYDYVMLLQTYFAKHIERARRFVWSLTVPVPDLNYSIIAFGGNCTPTPARMVMETVDGDTHFRHLPKQIKNPRKGFDYARMMLEPGDGRVTKPSMLARHFLHPELPRHKYSFFPLDYAFFLCHSHGQLTGNINFQDNLLNALLERDYDQVSRDEVSDLMQ